jgi:hypothetical protein
MVAAHWRGGGNSCSASGDQRPGVALQFLDAFREKDQSQVQRPMGSNPCPSLQILQFSCISGFASKSAMLVTSGPRPVHNSTSLMLQTMIVFHNQLIRAYVHLQWYIPKKIGDIISTNQVLLPKWRWNRCVT